AARAGITVPVPGAADIAALLIDANGKSELAQPVQHVHPGKARADHDNVKSPVAAAFRNGWRDRHRGTPLAIPFSVRGQHSPHCAKAQGRMQMRWRRGIFYAAESFHVGTT